MFRFQITQKIEYFPWFLYLLIVIGFLLRISAIKFGLPLQLDIDEPAVISRTLRLSNGPNIGYFDWPHLYFYINFLFYLPGYLIAKQFPLSFFGESENIYFLVSRLLSVIFGTITIPAIYIVSLKIYKNKSIALISALLITFLPIHVFESFLANIDIALTFFATVFLYWIIKIQESPTRKNYIIAGLICGLSISIKYNAFLLFFPLVISHYYSSASFKSSIKKINNLFLSGIFTLIGFIIGTPFSVIDLRHFWSYEPRVGLLWQFTNVGNILWSNYATSAYETFITMYRNDLGFGVWVVFILAVFCYLFFNYRNRFLNILILPTIIISFYISKFERSPSHYFLFLIPLYIPVISKVLFDFHSKLISKFPKLELRFSLLVFAIIILFPSMYSSVKIAYTYSRDDTRLLAYKWYKENIGINAYPIYMSGDNIDKLVFQEKRSEAIKVISPGQIEEPLPVLLLLGYNNVDYNKLISTDYNPKEIHGDVDEVLRNAELLYYAPNHYRPGPPVMLFKVTRLATENE